jgi:hypothetical protein
MRLLTLPTNYTRIKLVQSYHELATTPFANGINALCWPRELPGDFPDILQHLPTGAGITRLEDSFLQALPLSHGGRVAIEVLLEDLRQLRGQGLAPELNSIRGYPRDEDAGPVPTDVFSFHVDSAMVETDTWLCTYFGPASDGLRNDEATRRVDVPETRAQLLALYGGQDDDDFLEYLNDNCYDLHYAPMPHAQPFSFGLGNLWRIAAEYPGSPVPPCIHRAPQTSPGDPPRLLLIS